MASLSVSLQNLLKNINYQYAMASKQNASNIANSASSKTTNSSTANASTANISSLTAKTTSVKTAATVKTSAAATAAKTTATSSSSSALAKLLGSIAKKTSVLENTTVITNDMVTEFFKSYKNATMTAIYNKIQTGSAMTETDLANFKSQVAKLSTDEQKLWKTEIAKIQTQIESKVVKTVVNTNNTSNNSSSSNNNSTSNTSANTTTASTASTVVNKTTDSYGNVLGYDSNGTLVYLEKNVNGKKVVYTDELQYLNAKTLKYLKSVDEAVLNDRLLDDIKIVKNAEAAALKAGAKGTSAYQAAYNASIKSQMIKTTATAQNVAGEVVEQNGSLYVNDGSRLVKLNISSETYLELFPPVDRYDINQNSIGDCYFVSGCLTDLMKNGETYAELLQMFSEDSNGNITVRFAGTLGSYPVTFQNGDLKIMDGYVNGQTVKKYSNASGSLGTQMLEQAYSIARFSKESGEGVNSIDIDETISTIKGGWQYNVYNEVLGMKSERPAIDASSVASYLNSMAAKVNNDDVILSFASYGTNSEYKLTSSHAYSIESIDTANKVVYITNPWFSGGSIAVPYDVFAQAAYSVNDKVYFNVGYVNA